MVPFDSIAIKWGGVENVVPPDRVMGLIATIERHMTFEDLIECSRNMRRAQLAATFSAVIKYSGGSATTEEVYSSMFSEDGYVNALSTVNALLRMMIPPEHLREPVDESGDPDDIDTSEEQPKGGEGAKKKR